MEDHQSDQLQLKGGSKVQCRIKVLNENVDHQAVHQESEEFILPANQSLLMRPQLPEATSSRVKIGISVAKDQLREQQNHQGLRRGHVKNLKVTKDRSL